MWFIVNLGTKNRLIESQVHILSWRYDLKAKPGFYGATLKIGGHFNAEFNFQY
jgi:hypothetical protein